MKKLVAALFLCGVMLAADSPGVWLDVPFVKQEKDGCGAASIAMVMQYWFRQQLKPETDADPIEIQRTLYSKEGHGIFASDLEHYFQSHGFQTFVFSGSWENLQRQLTQGRPLIVAVKPGGRGTEHYVVVAGLEGDHSVVLVNDPMQRKLLKQDWSTFEKQWSAAGKWTLLAVPQQ
ncbi:MAG TPA: C39 family peptidase [Candidatus Angelobacter sp.]